MCIRDSLQGHVGPLNEHLDQRDGDSEFGDRTATLSSREKGPKGPFFYSKIIIPIKIVIYAKFLKWDFGGILDVFWGLLPPVNETGHRS